MSKNKVLTKWENVYKLPLHNDKYGVYAWSENGTMSLMFNSLVSKQDREKIINAINKTEPLKIKGLEKLGVDFLQNGTQIFCVRGWGNLTGVGALNLPLEEAEKVQDGFIDYIFKTLKP